MTRILFFILCVWSISSFAFFDVYVENNTPYIAHLGKSFYNEAPFTLNVTEVAPFSKNVKVGSALQAPSSTAPIALYVRIGDREDYWVTPLLILYTSQPRMDKEEDMHLEPRQLFMDHETKSFEEFIAKVVPDGASNSVVLSITPAV